MKIAVSTISSTCTLLRSPVPEKNQLSSKYLVPIQSKMDKQTLTSDHRVRQYDPPISETQQFRPEAKIFLLRLHSIRQHNPGTLVAIKPLVVKHNHRDQGAVSRCNFDFFACEITMHVCYVFLAHKCRLLGCHVVGKSFCRCYRSSELVAHLVVIKTVVVLQTDIEEVGNLFCLWV